MRKILADGCKAKNVQIQQAKTVQVYVNSYVEINKKRQKRTEAANKKRKKNYEGELASVTFVILNTAQNKW